MFATRYSYNKVFRALSLLVLFLAPITLYAQRMKAVDLGLSVRWANMNVGADTPEDYGDYFAWGEVKTKRYYGRYSTYKYYDSNRFLKYNNVGYKGSVKDNLLRLESGDDAASKRIGKGWRMPTETEMEELLEKCIFRAAVSDGTRGFWVKNRNEQGDSIFLPMAGYKDYGAYRFYPGTQCYYWTSTLLTEESLGKAGADSNVSDAPRSAVCLSYKGTDSPRIGFLDRRAGCVIRPVRR